MKKLLSLLILPSLIFFNANAQNNDLVIFAEEATPFYLVMNGIKQNEKAETNVKITDIQTTNNSVKIIFENQSIPVLSKTIYFDTINTQYSYRIISTKKKGYKLRGFDRTPKANVPQNNNATTIIYRTVNAPPSKTVVKETVTTTTSTDNIDNANVNVNMGESNINMNVNMNDNMDDEENVNMNMSVNMNVGAQSDPVNSENVSLNMNVNVNDNMDMNHEENINMNMNVSGNNLDNVETTSYSSTTTTTTTTTSWGDNTYTESTTTTNNGWEDDSNLGNSSSFSNTDCEVQNVERILNAIENESFNDDKMMVAKQATNKKCLSVQQIKQIMDKFSFEDNKLEFAKSAYSNCLNKDEYYMVNESFTFSSSKSELNDYISNQ